MLEAAGRWVGIVALAVLGVQRLAELVYARWTSRRLLQAGARQVRPDGMAGIVAVHVAFFVGAGVELFSPWASMGWWSLAGLAAFLLGQALRASSMVTLGWRWSTRVDILAAPPLVAGPYRFLRHPIYVGVVLELAGFQAMFGLWASLVLVGILHALALRRRIRIESHALGYVL